MWADPAKEPWASAQRLICGLAERSTKDGHAQLLDWEKSLLGTDGQPRAELFRPDRLHLNDDGYKIWLLKPHLAVR